MGLNYFDDLFEKFGFREVQDPKIGDGILFKVYCNVPNHCGIYLGEDVFLHHAINRISCRENLYPFLTFSENRHLREVIYKGYVNKGKNKNSNNNEKILLEITNLREQRAKILGFDSHTELALQNTMAESKKNVLELLDNVWGPATKRAQEEIKEIQGLIQQEGRNFKLEPWDWWFYSEKVRQAKFNYSEEEMRPYLSLDNIQKAAFTTAERLFDIKFKSLSASLEIFVKIGPKTVIS